MSAKEASPQDIAVKLYRYNRVIDRLLSPEDLKEEHLHFYRQQGYLAFADILEAELVQACKEALMNLIFVDRKGAYIQFTKPQEQLKTPEERELAVRKIAQYVDHDETLRQAAFHPRILRIVEWLMDEEPKLVQDMALLKPPYGGGEKPWHQDMAYRPLAFDKPVVGVWIALDPAGLENGCMHVIPRSHMDGGMPHYAVRDWQICDTNVQVERDLAVPLPPGGALFFHGMLHHGTPPNFSTKRRRALQFHYAPKSAVPLTPAEYKRIFTNVMTNAEC